MYHKGCFASSSSFARGWDRSYGFVTTHAYSILPTHELMPITDVEPDDILVNHSDNESRFSDVTLADCGHSTHIDSVVEERIISATIFRSPEAMLNLIWGPPTDIWSLGATAGLPFTTMIDESFPPTL